MTHISIIVYGTIFYGLMNSRIIHTEVLRHSVPIRETECFNTMFLLPTLRMPMCGIQRVAQKKSHIEG